MYFNQLNKFSQFGKRILSISLFALILAWLLWYPSMLRAQDQSQQPTANGQQPAPEPPPAAGGPQNDVGPYAIPSKKDEPPPPPPPERPKKIEGMPDYSIKVDVPLVNVDVMVMTKEG